jgi:dihydroxyacetone kinase phosphotransfer subunit
MVGLVIVSHSCKIAEGVVDLAAQMAPGYDGIRAAGGLEDGEIGTDATRIMEAIEEVDSGDGVLILCDLGSAIMSAETAIELMEDSGIEIRIADAPIVEGAIVAAVEAVAGEPLDSVLAAAEGAREELKL